MSSNRRLDALIAVNVLHVRALSPSLRRHQDRIIALANAVGRSHGPQERAVLLHGDLHAGNLLLDSNNELVVIDPTPALGEPEQDIGDAAAKNDWAQDLSTRVKQLAEACHADSTKAAAYARLAAWNAASSTPPQEPSRQEEWTRTNCSSTQPPSPGSCSAPRT